MKLYLIRHGESANNVIFSGGGGDAGRMPDPELTETGHKQAQALGEHMAHPEGEPQDHPWTIRNDSARGFGLSHIYCSLMIRSILTAGYVAEACDLPLVVHEDIFEKEGIYEESPDGTKTGLPGPDRSYFEDRFPHMVLPTGMSAGGWYNRPFETDDVFLGRSRKVADDIQRRHGDTDDHVAMVMHGDLIDQLINEFTGTVRHAANYANHWVANWAFHNTSITRLDFGAGSRVVVYTNRLQHLSPDLVTW